MDGYYIPHNVYSGKDNMDIDEMLLKYAISHCLKAPVLRLYGWSPACISLGRNQDDSSINKLLCCDKNIDIVKRLTGGRALLHDNELTYSIVAPVSFFKDGESIIKSYKEISGFLQYSLNKLGIDTNFPVEKNVSTKYEYCMSLATGADLSWHGKKIVGSAQYRKQGYVLQHGSILFSYNSELIAEIFNEKPLCEKIITLLDIDSSITLERLNAVLLMGFSEFFSVNPIDISQDEELVPLLSRHV